MVKSFFIKYLNKRAGIGDIVMDNVIYLILLIMFFVGMLAFVNSKMNGAAVWEDYYAKEIVKIIDSSKPGDEIILDVHKATEVAKANKIADFEQIFHFYNNASEVCVKLSAGRSSCYSYFNNVNVGITPFGDRQQWVYLAEGAGSSVNRLHFSIFPKGELNK